MISVGNLRDMEKAGLWFCIRVGGAAILKCVESDIPVRVNKVSQMADVSASREHSRQLYDCFSARIYAKKNLEDPKMHTLRRFHRALISPLKIMHFSSEVEVDHDH